MRLLHRLGLEDDVVEPDMLTGEARLAVGPEFEKRLDVFVGDLAARCEIRRLDGLEFLFQPAGADAQDETPTGQHVAGLQHFGRQYRGAMRTAQHRDEYP